MSPRDPTGSLHLTESRVRQLTATELGLISPTEPPADERARDLGIADDDRLLTATSELLDYWGGVIFTGPPGTSKSWYASNIATKLTGGKPELVRFVQFHPSYQYEDFVEGYVPNASGGFDLRPKHLLELCQVAEAHPGEWVVLVIDELSRGDPGRIFGEALTYVERTKRGFEFYLSSGTQLSIPANLVFLATMNPLDRGVDEVDAAFERRFAKIAMDPDSDRLQQFLIEAGMDDALRERVLAFFQAANARARSDPVSALGHTFFLGVGNEADLRRLWDYQLRFLFEKTYRLDPAGLGALQRSWDRIFERPAAAAAETGSTMPDTPATPPEPEVDEHTATRAP